MLRGVRFRACFIGSRTHPTPGTAHFGTLILRGTLAVLDDCIKSP
jgi:hypothetical protein